MSPSFSFVAIGDDSRAAFRLSLKAITLFMRGIVNSLDSVALFQRIAECSHCNIGKFTQGLTHFS